MVKEKLENIFETEHLSTGIEETEVEVWRNLQKVNLSQMLFINMTLIYIKIGEYSYFISVFLSTQLLSTSFASKIFKEPISPSHSTSLFTISIRFL